MSLSTLKSDEFDGGGGLTRDQKRGLFAILAELAIRLCGFLKEAADAAAATATAETPFFTAARYSLKFIGFAYLPAAALTADDAHYATLTVRKRTAAGGDGGVVAEVKTQITGGSGDWTAFKNVNIPLAAGGDGFTLNAGESLTFEITKAGNGVVVPAGQLQLVFC